MVDLGLGNVHCAHSESQHRRPLRLEERKLATSVKASPAYSPNDTELERKALAWMEEPYEHFGYSATRLNSVRREEMEAVQLTAMNLRLQQRRSQIKTLGKLADAQNIGTIATLDDM